MAIVTNVTIAMCMQLYSATSFETFEINDDENSFMTKALLQALDYSKGKMLKNDLYDHIIRC